MSSKVPRVRPGEPLRAARQNELIDQANTAAKLSIGGPLVGGGGQTGIRAGMRDPRRIALWELTGPLARNTTDGVIDDVPSAEAAPVWYQDVDGYSPENVYADAGSYTRSMRIYHVDGFPGDQRTEVASLVAGQPGEIAVPKYATGDRVYAQFNNQSGRWEILAPAEDLWRFELKTPLVPNGIRNTPAVATAYLVVYRAGEYVTTSVEFTVADFLDIWEGDPGCRGFAKRLADSHQSAGWEVLVLESEMWPCTRREDSGSSSGQWSSSGVLPSSGSSSGGDGLTTSIDVVTGEPYRSGDEICFPRQRLHFTAGLLTAVELLDDVCVYVCCDETSGSSSSSSSAPEEPSSSA